MAVEFRKGDRVYSPRFGRGEVLALWGGRMTLRFEDGSELKVQDPEAIRLERVEAAPVPAGEPAGPKDETMEPDELRRLLREALEEVLGPMDARIGDRWKGGTLVLKPGRADTLEKEIPLETFFQKIVRVRDQLRVLEQKVNSNPALEAAEKIALQQYVTRCYGALTTFNVLFRDAEDRFVGGAGA